jgi:hypothetical protein
LLPFFALASLGQVWALASARRWSKATHCVCFKRLVGIDGVAAAERGVRVSPIAAEILAQKNHN